MLGGKGSGVQFAFIEVINLSDQAYAVAVDDRNHIYHWEFKGKGARKPSEASVKAFDDFEDSILGLASWEAGKCLKLHTPKVSLFRNNRKEPKFPNITTFIIFLPGICNAL